MTPMAVFRQLGGLSTQWFMYAEDMDYCARVRDHGRSVVHISDVRVWHEVGASSDGASTMWIDSMEDFYVARWQPGRAALVTWRLAIATGLLARAVAYATLALCSTDRSDMWWHQSSQFFRFARHIARLKVGRPDD